MPPYLRVGSIPPKRHMAHPAQPGYRGEGIYYEEVVTTAVASVASVQRLLSPPAADARPQA